MSVKQEKLDYIANWELDYNDELPKHYKHKLISQLTLDGIKSKLAERANWHAFGSIIRFGETK